MEGIVREKASLSEESEASPASGIRASDRTEAIQWQMIRGGIVDWLGESAEPKRDSEITLDRSGETITRIRDALDAGRWLDVQRQTEECWDDLRQRQQTAGLAGPEARCVERLVARSATTCRHLHALYLSASNRQVEEWFLPGGTLLECIANVYEWLDTLFAEVAGATADLATLRSFDHGAARWIAEYSGLFTRVYLSPIFARFRQMAKDRAPLQPSKELEAIVRHMALVRAGIVTFNWHMQRDFL